MGLTTITVFSTSFLFFSLLKGGKGGEKGKKKKGGGGGGAKVFVSSIFSPLPPLIFCTT